MLRSTVITMNPRSYEATSDGFPDLFSAFEEPDIQFATSSYYAFRSIKFSMKTEVWFSRYWQKIGFRGAHIQMNKINTG